MSGYEVTRVGLPEPRIVDGVSRLEDEAFGRGGLNEWHLPYLIRHGRLYILESETSIVGSASLLRDWDANKAYLIDFVIDKSLRNRGLGRVLLTEIIAALKQERFEYLELTVFKGNVEAWKLYEGLGFKRGEIYQDEYGRGQDRWLMSLDLRNAAI